MTTVLFNPLSDNRHGEQNAKKITEHLKNEEHRFTDLTTLDIGEYLSNAPADEKLIIAGGDGTIHYIINRLKGKVPEHPLYYFPTGSGNDFMTDIGKKDSGELILLNDYLKNLPSVSVDGGGSRTLQSRRQEDGTDAVQPSGGESKLFFNGIGYGIDGYCCEEGDKQKKLTTKPINYTAIAIKGLLKYFKPRSAVVTVDGVKHKYKHVWLAPTMNGRFYGGGMNIAPGQDRLDPEHKLTTIVFHCKSKLKTLIVFPSIFKGKHVKHTEMVEVLTGHTITVKFDRPTPLQIDGETYLNVSGYSACSGIPKENAATDEKEAQNA